MRFETDALARLEEGISLCGRYRQFLNLLDSES
jgi:hypothetical protein